MSARGGRAVLACVAWVMGALALGSCEGPEALPTVRVTVRDVRAITAPYGVTGGESVTVWVVFRADERTTLGPYGSARDAGAGTNEWDVRDGTRELRRAVYWPLRDPFEFTVQVPPVAFGQVRVYVTAPIICGSMGSGVVVPRERLLGAAEDAVSITPALDRVTDLTVTVADRRVDCTTP